jgi:cell division protein FtsA
MDEQAPKQDNRPPRCVVGLDIGSSSVKCVLASIDENNIPQIIATEQKPNRGLRKGVIVDLSAVAKTVDNVLGEIEKTTGFPISNVSMSINGSHISSILATGMVATGPSGHIIGDDDLERVKEVALMGKIPPNHQIISTTALEYTLDSQIGIKDPRGMIGSRLEVKLSVIMALQPFIDNAKRLVELVNLSVGQVDIPAIAASKAVLTDEQTENGVVLIDLGATTTGIAVYEEGDLRFASVIPIGSNNITNDLAMGLKTTPAVAEMIKCQKMGDRISIADAGEDILVNVEDREQIFRMVDVNDIVDARLDEIFMSIREELRKAGYDRRLPEGAVLVGGGAKLKLIKTYAEEKLEMAVKIGSLVDISSIENISNKIELSCAVGLMLDSFKGEQAAEKSEKQVKNPSFIKKLFGKVKF